LRNGKGKIKDVIQQVPVGRIWEGDCLVFLLYFVMVMTALANECVAHTLEF